MAETKWVRGLWRELGFGVVLGCALGAVLGVVGVAEAQESVPTAGTLDRKVLPKELEDWVPWVESRLGERVCPAFSGAVACVWPGTLDLDLTASGGTFVENVVVFAEAEHQLPGGVGAWPEGVDLGGRRIPVLDRGGVPRVLLPKGAHVLRGTFGWNKLPERLAVGRMTGLVSLTVSGKKQELVKREAEQVWLTGLSEEAGSAAEPAAVELRVFRRIEDGVPPTVETRLVFRVSGSARELVLPPPLLAGSKPLLVQGDLATRLEDSGELRVQLEPGKHELTLVARLGEMPAEIPLGERAAPWPREEVWTFHPDPALRSVELGGALGIDSSRTELPPEWRDDGAYLLTPGQKLGIVTTRRGEEQLPQNRVELSRELWLDEAAGHFTVRDRLTGEMHQGFRLDSTAGQLGQVEFRGESQVITRAPEGGNRGVEVRLGTLGVSAVSRLPRTTELAAVGWKQDVDSLSVQLRLPPGWSLLGTSGVDETDGTWLSRWNLFAVFYVLVLSLSLAKLVSPLAGVVGAAATILTYGEDDSLVFVWLPLVALVALVVFIKVERIQRVLRLAMNVYALCVFVALVSFAVSQVRVAIYPHLADDFAFQAQYPASSMSEAPVEEFADNKEGGTGTRAMGDVGDPMTEGMDVPAQVAAPAAPPVDQEQALRREVSKSKRFSAKSAALELDAISGGYDPRAQLMNKTDAVVQTGPGIPNGPTRAYQLRWSGPVTEDHTMRLYLSSPWMGRLATVLRLGLLGLLGFFVLVAARRGSSAAPPDGAPPTTTPVTTTSGGSTAAAVTGGAVLALFLLLAPSIARAEEPSAELLSELEDRMTRVPACGTACVAVSRLDVELERGLTLAAEVHAEASTVYKLPGPASVLAGVGIEVDGAPARAVRLGDDGAYYLHLARGVHRVKLTGRPVTDQVNLDVGTPPARIVTRARGWTISGVGDDGRARGGTLTLERSITQGAEAEGEPTSESQAARVNVPPYFSVERTLRFFLTGQVATRIVRRSAPGSAEVLRLRLLPGERITTPGIVTESGVASVPFSREVTEQVIESTLALPSDGSPFELSLTAPPFDVQTETWRLECGVVWSCTATGVVPTSHLEGGRAQSTYRPFPGETLKVRAIEPQPADGLTLTVHQAKLALTPGVRTGRGTLELDVQTTRAAVHPVRLPSGAKLDRVTVDGAAQPVRSEGGAVRISLAPGRHTVIVAWQDPSGLTAVFRSPTVDAGAPGVNFRTTVELPSERWLLLAGGPAQGPALLFWGYLVLIVIAAVLLPKLPFAPLTAVQWLLFGLGLTQVPSELAVFIAGWFFAMGARRQVLPRLGRWRRNLLQLVLVVYTLTFVSCLFGAVYEGLVSSPDMEVVGAGSSNEHLEWYSDRSAGPLPSVWALSVSLWVWRAFMLAWALWLAKSLVGWMRWGAGELTVDGFWAPVPRRQSDQRAGANPESRVVTSDEDGGAAPTASDAPTEGSSLDEPPTPAPDDPERS